MANAPEEVAAQTFDRDFLVNAFLARMAVYQVKRNDARSRRPFDEGHVVTHGDIAEARLEAIEYLAQELGLTEDVTAAGYEWVL